MQKVQNLSQPWMMGMKAATSGFAERGPTQPSGSMPIRSPSRSMRGWNSCGRMKRSAYGKRSSRASVLGPTMQPMRATTRSGFFCFMGFRLVSIPTTRSSALCLTTQLLRTTTSASRGDAAEERPICPSALSSRSESALFI